MQNEKYFNQWRAEKLGYVFLSRFDELIIKEENSQDCLFDYLIDIGDNHKQTGRLFGVEIKAVNERHTNFKSLNELYRNITFPLLLLVFDNQTDEGYFTWIKEPKDNGRLIFNSSSEASTELNNNSLQSIVDEVKQWYAHQLVVSE